METLLIDPMAANNGVKRESAKPEIGRCRQGSCYPAVAGGVEGINQDNKVTVSC